MPRLYRYVGDETIKQTAPTGSESRTLVQGPGDVLSWITETEQAVDSEGTVVATFVIDPQGRLWIADRRSEHFHCAGGGEVLSAGEVTFHVTDNTVEVIEISNQSTGYCPEPESYFSVASAMDAAGIACPSEFTTEFVFRRCDRCGTTNIVKDGWFECEVCGASLPGGWNFSSPGQAATDA
jgi:hypothetical protein